MNIWKISILNIKSKPLYTFLSVAILALSIALLLGIQQLKKSFLYQIQHNLGGVDLVVGAKGSPLQLVLSSVLHLDNPTGNIAYAEAKKIGKNPMVKMAVPISFGDNYKGLKIVGTTSDFLTLYNAKIQKGRFAENVMEVVIGQQVAERFKIEIGATLLSSHGLLANDIEVHEEPFKVVGILEATHKVIDRLIITNLESVWEVHEHEEAHIEDDHAEDKEITSLLISFKNPRAMLTFPRKINQKTTLQAALPKYELKRLLEYTSVGFKTISWIAYIILFIAGITIFISLYKMVKERAFDLALLRTYGASNTQLIQMVFYEGLLVVTIAFVVGYLIAKSGLHILFSLFESGNPQIPLQELSLLQISEVIGLVFVMIIVSTLLAIYPIVKMNISTILTNEK